jgi:hypothetical protein
MTFKAQTALDLDQVFFNLEEFADLHRLDRREMPVLVDSDQLADRKAKHGEGTFTDDLLIFVKARDYGPRPKIKALVDLDGVRYRVAAFQENIGVYEITLEAIKA